MDSLPTKCGFCGKQKAEAKILMVGPAVNWDSEQLRNSICAECLGLQMGVLANLDNALFEKLVETARKRPSEPQSLN